MTPGFTTHESSGGRKQKRTLNIPVNPWEISDTYSKLLMSVTAHKGGWEELPYVWCQGKKPGGLHARAVVAKRSYPTSKVRGSGWEEQPHVQGVVAAWAQEGREELLHIQGQEGQQEIPLVQGKGQRLCFAGAAMKRYPTSKVRETQGRFSW